MFKFGTKIENDELECEVKPIIFKTADDIRLLKVFLKILACHREHFLL